MSGRLSGRRAVWICQCVQGSRECRLLLWCHARGSRRPARRRGQTNASCEAAPRRGIEGRGSERLDCRLLPRHPAAPHATESTMKKATPAMKNSKSGSKDVKAGDSPSRLIDARIKELGDWRGETLTRVRALIKQADPEVVEEWKWRGVPVWEHAGIICTGETYKAVVKLTFAKGASLEDPSGLFNSSLEGNVRRAIDIHEGDKIDEKALKALIRAAVALHTSKRATAGAVRAQKKPKSA